MIAVVAGAAGVGGAIGLASSESPAELGGPARANVRYGRDVRPILSDRCFQCHGPDPATREAGLRLDEHAGATAARKGGPGAIVPGDAGASELIRRITSTDPNLMMPPPTSNKRPLSPEEKETLRSWVEQGAEYEPHWAFVPPVAPALPEVRGESWARNEIDRFVLAGLEARGVEPSPAADGATLLRRVFLDLTGLPPTPEELDAFLADGASDAYERWVERLLTQEPYRTRVAERMTAPWLDAARYADTCGIHMDNGRQMWAWRDWVIEAFRSNMPYDRFLTEQIAGDLLPEATQSQKVASGFNRNHVTTDEGGAIAAEYLVEYAVDRVSTTSTVFLGLTMGCARCHDHKYDPFTQEDFYGLFAFFNSIEEPGLYSQTQDSNRAYEPFMDVPSAEQAAALENVLNRIREHDARMNQPLPGEREARAEFAGRLQSESGMRWTTPRVIGASSTDPKVQLTPAADGLITASGPVPDAEDYSITLRTDETDLRLVLLEALPAAEGGGAGRFGNLNAVLSGVTLEARRAGSNDDWRPAPLRWAGADLSQQNGDFDAGNVLSADARGWAIAGHQQPGSRLLVLLTDQPVGEPGGTELRVTLSFRSMYAGHSLAKVRLRVSPYASAALASLPVRHGRWHLSGPFQTDGRDDAQDRQFGPESSFNLDEKVGDKAWTFSEAYVDGRPVNIPPTPGASYLGRWVWSPDARRVQVSLGSDDGFRLFVNGVEVAAKRTERSLAPNQDTATIDLRPGANSLVLRIANTGGEAGYFYQAAAGEGELSGDLVMAIAPEEVLSAEQRSRLDTAFRRSRLPEYAALEKARMALADEERRVRVGIPKTMVMKELEKPRETFVLSRGVYDQPDRARPVNRQVPAALGSLPAGAPANRLGLAQWMTGKDNPLTARVAVNRCWEMLFGVGLVRTPENFGFQGEWPTHPELLDWLATDFAGHGWDVRRLITQIVQSSTYRQSSRVREDLAAIDAENRLLAYYPRRRLSAEHLRDLALYTSGLLVERAGGPSVKPYQPDGLWQEVAMPGSNTRFYTRGEGDELWRRTIYTYWKRALPPPSMLTLDIPTRESCVIRRPATNTPLQALVLWNDEQFVEAARALTARTLAEQGDDDTRIARLFRRVTGRTPEKEELAAMREALGAFRARFSADPIAAADFVNVGESPITDDPPARELAPWTLLANAVLNLHEALTQD